MKFTHLFLYVVLAVFSLFSLTACDKMDENGPFEGYWLLMDYDGYDGNRCPEGTMHTPITEGGNYPTDIPTATQQTIVWGVRNELIEIRNFAYPDHYFCHFTRNASELQLTDLFRNDGSNDTRIELSEAPAEFCIPADGRFIIVQLDNKHLQLKAEGITLTFKKN